MMIEAPREQWLIDMYANFQEWFGEDYEAFIADRGYAVRVWISEYSRAKSMNEEDACMDCIFEEFDRWEQGEGALHDELKAQGL